MIDLLVFFATWTRHCHAASAPLDVPSLLLHVLPSAEVAPALLADTLDAVSLSGLNDCVPRISNLLSQRCIMSQPAKVAHDGLSRRLSEKEFGRAVGDEVCSDVLNLCTRETTAVSCR